MNAELFSGSSSGRLLTVGQGELAFQAFAPGPLPPDLILDAELIFLLSEADRALGELAGLGRMLPNPNLLIRPFAHREAVLSSRIEGTQANIEELYGYEAGQVLLPSARLPRPESELREVSNYLAALDHGLKLLAELPVSLRLIRMVHARLMNGVRGDRATPGEYRRSQSWIGPSGCSLADATYVPPPVPEMTEALDSLEKYLHVETGFPPLVRLGLIHYQFEAIHPFLDGNGRVGRLLLVLLLVSWDLLPQPLLYLSAYFERNRDEYYRLLLSVSTQGAWKDWTGFFLRGVATQARDAVARAKRIQDLQALWRNKLMTGRSAATLLRLADSLFEQPVITIPMAAERLGITYPAAKSCVQKLIDVGALQPWNIGGRVKLFVADRILEIVREGDD